MPTRCRTVSESPCGSLEILRIESGWSTDELVQGGKKIAEANGIGEGLIRITLTAGERTTGRGNATITSRDLPETLSNPTLHGSTVVRRMSGPLSQCKSIAQSGESAALRGGSGGRVRRDPPEREGCIVETTARNLFIVGDGVLWTPPTDDGALPGITRAAVLDVARQEKIRVRERSVSVERLRASEELFLTGSSVGVLGIAAVDGHRYDALGRVTERLRAGYRTSLDRESTW